MKTLFLKIGDISLLNEHLSERLQIRIANENKSDAIRHVSMISTTLMNVSSFLQILVEANMKQSEQDSAKFQFDLPEPLEKYYLRK
jgi:hypothetical protein